ncbi:MAG: hypothetical protein ACOX8H_08820 [Ruminococcus sp.]|jgi:hypothetical protein
MKKRKLLIGGAAVLLLGLLIIGVLLFHTLQKKKEETAAREEEFWSREEIRGLEIMDPDALSFQAEQNGDHPVRGIISSYDFNREGKTFRLLVYMEDRDGENCLSFRLYRQEEKGYELLQNWQAEGSLFRSFWDMECSLKVFLREREDALELVCGQREYQMEGIREDYQIFRFDGEIFEETFQLKFLRETVSVQVEKNHEIIYDSQGDGGEISGAYSDPDEAAAQELANEEIEEEDFEESKNPGKYDICFLASARTGDTWLTGEFSGTLKDYTGLRTRMEELGIYGMDGS